MRGTTTASCDVHACLQQLEGNLAEVAQRQAAGGWWTLRLEAVLGARACLLCHDHGRALLSGTALEIDRRSWSDDRAMDRTLVLIEAPAVCGIANCPQTAAAGEAWEWSELRADLVAVPGASFVTRVCPHHVRAVLGGSRLAVPLERWVRDLATTRSLAQLLSAPMSELPLVREGA